MAKELVSAPVGADGGKASLVVAGGMLEAKLSIPTAKVLEPIKTQFVDRLKQAIPGTWDDKIIDDAWADAVAYLSE